MKIQVGKKELSEKQKKILRKVKVILQYVFIFLSLLIATTVAWVFRTWKGLTMEEVVFQIQAPTTGTDSGIFRNEYQFQQHGAGDQKSENSGV